MKYGEENIKNARLEFWPNPEKTNRYQIEITYPEFTCLCPRSGYPDFATIIIKYIPKDLIVELRSLKLYLNKFRNEYISHEAVVNKIYNDLKKGLKPRFLEIIGDFNVRGNVKTIVSVKSKS
ncbi:MAG: preQ(1) synthase [Deltaproteobacteria bacterium]|nr:preQ(1) synthase [Deltaproteobacteria bacterium]